MKKIVAWICCLWLAVAFASSAYDTGCGNKEPPPEECEEVGSSIKPYNANKRRSVTDLETFGAAPIAFTRIYNSRTTTFNTNYWEFGWKQTWQHNWNYEVRDLSSETFGQKDVKVRYPSGSEFNFKATDESGTIRAPYAYHGDRLYKWSGSTVGHTLVTPGGWEYDFQRTTSPRYRLVRVRNGQGFQWTLSYDAQGRILRIENNFGRWLEIDRDTAHGFPRITAVRSSDGRQVNYSYVDWIDGDVTNSVLSAVTYPDGSQAQYTYVGAQSLTNGRPLLATASDPRHRGAGARVKFVYNYDAVFDFGNGPYLVTGTTKEERNLDTDELIVQLPLGAGDYPQILLGDGTEITRKYSDGLLVEERDGEGRPTFYSRDQGGSGFIGSKTDASGATTTYIRDYAGRILHEIDAHGKTNSFTYNTAGFVLTETDKLGRTTAYTRDAGNRPTRIDYPDGSFEQWTYNEFGQVLTHRLRNGGTETFSYNASGDMTTRTDPLGNTTTFTYHPNGLVASVTDPRGNTTSFTYNWRGQVTQITNPDGSSQTFAYDAFGNRTTVVNELGHVTSFTYDAYNRVASVTDPLGRTTSYEYGRAPAAGGCGSCGTVDLISRITDPAGKKTEYTYDRSDKRISETLAAGTTEASTTTWTYDEVGRMKTQTDANGNTYTWVYDALGRVIAETNALGQATTYTYDAVGNRLTRTDGAGITTFWEYDAANRVTATGSGTLSYEYSYDTGGRRTAMRTRVNGVVTETTTYTYDLNDRLLTKTDPTGYVLSYSYDSAGNRTGLLVGSAGDSPVTYLSQSYAYDTRNRVVNITGNGKTTSFSYDAASRLIAQTLPNGTTVTNAFDDANQLLLRLHRRSDASTIASFAYTYDLSGNRTSMTTLEGVNAYTYDARNWLTSAMYPDGRTEQFEYDPVGNRTKSTDSVHGVSTYSYGAGNRLLSDSNGTYSYDNAGRLIAQTLNGQSRSYQYSFRGQMTSLTDTNGTTFTCEFDGDGNRISASVAGCLTARYVYDGPNVVLDLNASNEVVHAYVQGLGIDQPIERIAFIGGAQSTRLVYHTDGLGSVVVLTDSGQQTAKSYTYEAFGRIRSEGGNALVVNRYTYTAREAVGDSLGLYYYRWRVMDPNVGRFTSEDPLGFFDQVELYVYVANSPVDIVDPSGLMGKPQKPKTPPIPITPPPLPPTDDSSYVSKCMDACDYMCSKLPCPNQCTKKCYDSCMDLKPPDFTGGFFPDTKPGYSRAPGPKHGPTTPVSPKTPPTPIYYPTKDPWR